MILESQPPHRIVYLLFTLTNENNVLTLNFQWVIHTACHAHQVQGYLAHEKTPPPRPLWWS